MPVPPTTGKLWYVCTITLKIIRIVNDYQNSDGSFVDTFFFSYETDGTYSVGNHACEYQNGKMDAHSMRIYVRLHENVLFKLQIMFMYVHTNAYFI